MQQKGPHKNMLYGVPRGAQIYTNSFGGPWRPSQGNIQGLQVTVQNQSNSSYTEDPVYARPHLELIVQSFDHTIASKRPLGPSSNGVAQNSKHYVEADGVRPVGPHERFVISVPVTISKKRAPRGPVAISSRSRTR